MSTAETFALLEAAQSGDEEAGERVLRENTGLIWSVVRRYNGRGVETEDLYQLGCIGFLKAVKGFDLTYGTQFSTYAVPKIAGEIRRFLRDDGAIKVSRTLRERSQSIYSAREKLRVQLGREPVLSELAEETGCTAGRIVPLGAMYPSPGFRVEEIADADLASAAPESFQQEMGDGLTLETLLGTESPEESLIEQLSLRAAIDLLPERERMTILLRFFKALTQEQTARVLGVSQVQVSRLERRALQKLRTAMETEG